MKRPKNPEELAKNASVWISDGVRKLFGEEIGRLDDEDPVEKRAREILERVRDGLVGKPTLFEDRHRQ